MSVKSSIGGWAYIWGGYSEAPVALEDVAKKLSELGFDGIEMAAFPPHLEPNTKEKRAEVKKLFDKYGLGVSGLAAPFPSPATSAKEDYIKAVKENLQICIDLVFQSSGLTQMNHQQAFLAEWIMRPVFQKLLKSGMYLPRCAQKKA